MPIEIRRDIEGDVPNKPHLAMLTDESGLATAIEVGATMFIIEDPTRVDKIFPVYLAKVSRKAIVFLCACGQQSCTRQYRFINNTSGWHTQKKQNTITQDK